MNIQLGLNYSEAAARLVREGVIEIDFFKCPPWPEMIAAARQLRPVAVHFNLKAGGSRLDSEDWDATASLLAETGTPFINLHLECARRDLPAAAQGTAPDELRTLVLERMLADVQEVVRRFGAPRVIVENVPYRGPFDKVLPACVEPEVIRTIVHSTGCGLLLDLSHARISAHSLGLPAEEYFARLPLQSLREMHFTGLHQRHGELVDHLEALEADWVFLEWALERIRRGDWPSPWMMAFEYGGVGEKFAWRSDPAVIAEQVPRLYRLLHPIE